MGARTKERAKGGGRPLSSGSPDREGLGTHSIEERAQPPLLRDTQPAPCPRVAEKYSPQLAMHR